MHWGTKEPTIFQFLEDLRCCAITALILAGGAALIGALALAGFSALIAPHSSATSAAGAGPANNAHSSAPTVVGTAGDRSQPFTGTWEGFDTQGNTYVVFRLKQNGFDVNGRIEYPTLGCKGTLSTPVKTVISQVFLAQGHMQGSRSSQACTDGSQCALILPDNPSATAVAHGPGGDLTLTRVG